MLLSDRICLVAAFKGFTFVDTRRPFPETTAVKPPSHTSAGPVSFRVSERSTEIAGRRVCRTLVGLDEAAARCRLRSHPAAELIIWVETPASLAVRTSDPIVNDLSEPAVSGGRWPGSRGTGRRPPRRLPSPAVPAPAGRTGPPTSPPPPGRPVRSGSGPPARGRPCVPAARPR